MELPFKGQTALISGGLGDIGRAIALELASKGASIALADLQPPEKAAPLLEKLGELQTGCSYHAVDITEPAAVRQWVEAVTRALGPPRIIIANAAVVTPVSLLEMSADTWKRELDVNLNGAFFTAQAGARMLKEQGLPGRIVFIGSWAAHSVHPHVPAYSVSKAGLRMLCQCLALELAPHGILVNELAPGYVEAGLSAGFWKTNPAARETARLRVPVRQLIRAEEVAAQVTYLCHPDNRHLTGSTLLMDGGLSL